VRALSSSPYDDCHVILHIVDLRFLSLMESHDVAEHYLSGPSDWLRAKIHNVGSLHPSADELCQAVTAGPVCLVIVNICS